MLPQQEIAIEKHLPLELPPCQHGGKPEPIVSPHAVIRNLPERSPQGDGFFGFLRLPLTVRGCKDIHQKGKAIRKLKGELSTLLYTQWSDTELLLNFPYGALEG
jgi:hypothetical protein